MANSYINPAEPYAADLAYIHDIGYGAYARGAAPGVLKLLADGGMPSGMVVDLGCGSGIWAKELADCGYQVTGVDISPAMIAIAQERVPTACFQAASLWDFPIPVCRAVTALGEILNYLFDERNTLSALRTLGQKVFNALAPNGLFIFDLAEPGRSRDRQQSFREDSDWACLVQYEHDSLRQQLTRRIITFRKIGDSYRRHEEHHRLQLYDGTTVATVMREIGFQVQLVRAYDEFVLPPDVIGVIAKKA